jgi:hypothetical protein
MLIQFGELPLSQTPLLAFALQRSAGPGVNKVRPAGWLLVVPFRLPTTTL